MKFTMTMCFSLASKQFHRKGKLMVLHSLPPPVSKLYIRWMIPLTFANDNMNSQLPLPLFWITIVIAMGQQNDLSTQLEIQLNGFKLNLSHFSFLKFLYKKHIFRSFWGLSGGGRSGFYKNLCTRVLLRNAARDKKHPETRSLCIFCRIGVYLTVYKHSLIQQNTAWWRIKSQYGSL